MPLIHTVYYVPFCASMIAFDAENKAVIIARSSAVRETVRRLTL